MIILTFLTKFAQKGEFRLKCVQFNIIIELYTFKLV